MAIVIIQTAKRDEESLFNLTPIKNALAKKMEKILI